MAKKKTEELDNTAEVLLPEAQEEQAAPQEASVSPEDAEMDLNELLESLDAPAGIPEDELSEAEPQADADVPDSMDSLDVSEDAPPSYPAAEGPTMEDASGDTAESPPAEPSEEAVAPTPKKAKRTTKKKKEQEPDPVTAPADADESLPLQPTPIEERPAPAKKPVSTRRTAPKAAPILTLEARAEVETQESIEDTIWHEIHNAYRTRRMLTGMLGGIEQMENGKTIAIVDYKGFRIIIPLKEMVMGFPNNLSGNAYTEMVVRQHKILSNMLGAEIDFVVKGIDSKTRSAVASRKEAMLKKRQLFYLNTDAAGMYRIYDGRIIQARVIAVAEKVIRIEAFGVECSIMARDLSWDWIGDAHERFSVGDQILVRILSVTRNSLEDISIKADVKSVSENNNHDNLKKCRIQSKYAGKVTDVHKGVVYIRLTNGVNAIAHSCYDRRMPGKKDDVSFAVTHIDEERGVAMGIITRIIKQNL